MADSNSIFDENSLEINAETKEEMERIEKKRFRHFIYFFSGQQISILGSSVVSFVLIWWITETTQSELMLGLASLCSLGPYLLVAPFSGVIADKANRKMLLLVVDALQASFTIVLTIIFMFFYDPNSSTNNIPFLIGSIFVTLGLRGAMQAFHSPTVGAMVPTMVPEKHLSRMNGLAYLISGVINVGGPAIGAVLLGVFGISLTMWIDVITFSIAVIPLIFIKIPSISKEARKERPPFFTEFKEGISTIKDIKGLFALIFIATLINFFLSPLSTLLPIFVNKVHGGNKENYALVVGILQAGMIVGGLFMTFFKGFKNKIRTAIILVGVMFLGQALLYVVPTTINGRFWIIGVLLFLAILTNPAANVSLSTSLQVIVPKDKMGRVSSVLGFMSMAITPFGNFLSGLIGEFVPIGILFLASSIIGIVIMFGIYYLSSAKNLDKEISRKIEEIKRLKEVEEEKSELEEEFIFETTDDPAKQLKPTLAVESTSTIKTRTSID
ncbi:MAG TPA: MFS transporter [candidate division Zixibacteria bacterium]|nr:MFS transporter [candidate division Zixibacteria bacterium]